MAPETSDFPIVDADPGVTRQGLADHADLMVVAFRFQPKAQGKLHNHPHVQSTFVANRRFLFSVDGVETEVRGGDSFVIPSNATHDCTCLEASTLVDCFTPQRDDFL